jgi:hypothetical protein
MTGSAVGSSVITGSSVAGATVVAGAAGAQAASSRATIIKTAIRVYSFLDIDFLLLREICEMLAIEMPDCIGLHELRVRIDLQSSFIESVLKKLWPA